MPWLSDLCFNPDTSDVSVVFKDDEKSLTFPAHRFVLEHRSEVFRKMLATKNSFKEGSSGEVFLGGVPTKVAQSFMRFLYLDRFPECSATRLVELIRAGNLYAIPSLVKHCDMKLAQKLSLDNVCDIFCDLSKLELVVPDISVKTCLDFITTVFEIIALKSMHLDMEERELRAVLSSEQLNVSKEVVCIQALVEWAKRKCEEKSSAISNEQLIEIINPFKDCIKWNEVTDIELEPFGGLKEGLIEMKAGRDGTNLWTAACRTPRMLFHLRGFPVYHVVESCGCNDTDVYRKAILTLDGILRKYVILSFSVSERVVLLGLDISVPVYPGYPSSVVIRTDSINLSKECSVTVDKGFKVLPTPVLIEPGDMVNIEIATPYNKKADAVWKSEMSPKAANGVNFMIHNIIGLPFKLVFISL